MSLVELVVVLLGISGSAARYALGHDLAGVPLGFGADGAGAAGCVLMMNPWSGGGKVARSACSPRHSGGGGRSCSMWAAI